MLELADRGKFQLRDKTIGVVGVGNVTRLMRFVGDGRKRYTAEVVLGTETASLDADGAGLAQTSTARLRGRKLFVWGAGEGGRRWQEWLTEPGSGGYAEIQAGLAKLGFTSPHFAPAR